MYREHDLVRGACILSAAGLICRGAGFFFRIFLSRAFKEEGVGIYQLILPVYSLCFALCASGVQLALSRAVAKRAVQKKGSEAGRILFCGLCLSVGLSLICLFFLQKNADDIASGFLGEARCAPMLVLISYALPFSAAHSCATGYCYGSREVNIPALSQLIEQGGKILFVSVLYHILKTRMNPVPVDIAASGLIAGEILSCAFAFFCLREKPDLSFSFKAGAFACKGCVKELLNISVPVSCSRVLAAFLQSIEAASIPARLRMHGMSALSSLKIYGVLTGMALPCIFLPSVITNSLSSLLMPAVAQMQASPGKAGLKETIRKVSFSCLGLGLFCCLFFLIFGRRIGSLLFHSKTAGEFIASLSWICPFFYLNTTLISIITGLGKAPSAFLISAAGLVIRILYILFVIPAAGIKGYFRGLLSSQLAACALSSCEIFRIINRKEALK